MVVLLMSFFTCGEYGFGSMGSWYYFREKNVRNQWGERLKI